MGGQTFSFSYMDYTSQTKPASVKSVEIIFKGTTVYPHLKTTDWAVFGLNRNTQ